MSLLKKMKTARKWSVTNTKSSRDKRFNLLYLAKKNRLNLSWPCEYFFEDLKRHASRGKGSEEYKRHAGGKGQEI